MITTSGAAGLGLGILLALTSVHPAAAVSGENYERQVIASTNDYRAAHGRVALKAQRCVDRWAEGQARWMAKHDKLAHRPGRMLKVMKACGLSGAAENAAYAFPDGGSAVRAWAGSSGHAKNMRASKARYIGVGVSRDDDGAIYVAEVIGTP